MPTVATTFSFATSPETLATAACQLPKPSGAKIGAITPPIAASILMFSSSTMPKPPAVKPKFWRNQITPHATKMTVPALMMNALPRSHMWISTPFGAGKWYCGSSMTKGAGSPANILVFLRMTPERMTMKMPKK